ncbi:flavonol reductase [Geopyxis carbonaria]|nr:flavonol reductase [Geopyxis carbonaria]
MTKAVLVTGANGFIASHIIQQLLEKSYKVVGTVRNAAKSAELIALHPSWNTLNLTFASISDISQPGCYDNVLTSHKFDFVLHTASPYSTSIGGKEMLSAAIDGTSGILEAVATHAPTVERVVVTSSFGSIIDPSQGVWPGKTYTESDWNPISYETAAAPDADWITAYLASKALAERAAWDLARRPGTHFALTTLCPPMVYGPPINLAPRSALSRAGESTQIIYNLLHAGAATDPPPTGFWLWIDVRDLATAHVLALERPLEQVAGERFLVTAGNYSFQEICDVLREGLGSEEARGVPVGTPGGGVPEGGVYAADTAKSVEKLGMRYRSLQECVVDAARAVLQIGLTK